MTTAACQCSKHPGHPCDRPITQEDLRCDTCGGRDPKGYTCGSIVGLGGSGQYHLGMRINWGTHPQGAGISSVDFQELLRGHADLESERP